MLASRQLLGAAQRRGLLQLGVRRSMATVSDAPLDKQVKQNIWEAGNFINVGSPTPASIESLLTQ